LVLAFGQFMKRTSRNGFSTSKAMDVVLLWQTISSTVHFIFCLVDVIIQKHYSDMLHLQDLVILPGVCAVAFTLSNISTSSSDGKTTEVSKIRGKVFTVLWASGVMLAIIPVIETIIIESPLLDSLMNADVTTIFLSLAIANNLVSVCISLGTAFLFWTDFLTRRRLAEAMTIDPLRRNLNKHFDTVCITFSVGIVTAMVTKIHLDLFHVRGVTPNVDGFLYNLSSGCILATVMNVFISYNYGERGFEFLRPKVTVVLNSNEGKSSVEVLCVKRVPTMQRTGLTQNGNVGSETSPTTPTTVKGVNDASWGTHNENGVEELDVITQSLKFSYGNPRGKTKHFPGEPSSTPPSQKAFWMSAAMPSAPGA
ncbi:hypothetical protein HK102_007215, partial [Quaeritorhiza haematococci]